MAKEKDEDLYPIEDLYLSDEDMKRATIITEGRPSWTFRGHNLIFDKPAIVGASKIHKIASRIFLTGEVHFDYIGEEALEFLLGMDIKPPEIPVPPLFEETRRRTLRMTRFDPKFVWKCIHPDTLVELAGAEIERLQIEMDDTALEYLDFYESMIWFMKLKNGDFCIPSLKAGMTFDAHYHVTYLACLLLFGKPGYMGTPVGEFFSDPVSLEYLKDMEFRVLTKEEQKEAVNIRDKYCHINTLTNAEMQFAVRLYPETI